MWVQLYDTYPGSLQEHRVGVHLSLVNPQLMYHMVSVESAVRSTQCKVHFRDPRQLENLKI